MLAAGPELTIIAAASRERRLNGGPLAAPPGKTWHHRCAIDLGCSERGWS